MDLDLSSASLILSVTALVLIAVTRIGLRRQRESAERWREKLEQMDRDHIRRVYKSLQDRQHDSDVV